MAAATDKARFFLEQSVPELKEYEKKKIFSKVIHRSLFCPFVCFANTRRADIFIFCLG